MGFPTECVSIYVVQVHSEDATLYFKEADGCPFTHNRSDDGAFSVDVQFVPMHSTIVSVAEYNTQIYRSGHTSYITLEEYEYHIYSELQRDDIVQHSRKRRVHVLHSMNVGE